MHSERAWLYVVRAENGLCKIGVTQARNPRDRLRQIQFQSPLPVFTEFLTTTPDTHRFERFLHKKFSELRDHGEWFRLTSVEIAEIRGLAKQMNAGGVSDG